MMFRQAAFPPWYRWAADWARSSPGLAEARLFDHLVSTRHSPNETLWNVGRGPALLRLDVGRPDDRPPLIDLRLVVGIERLRRLLFARRKLHADVSEAPLRGGVGEGGRDRGVESGDDRLGRALGRPHPVPERKVQAGRARLIDRRHAG